MLAEVKKVTESSHSSEAMQAITSTTSSAANDTNTSADVSSTRNLSRSQSPVNNESLENKKQSTNITPSKIREQAGSSSVISSPSLSSSPVPVLTSPLNISGSELTNSAPYVLHPPLPPLASIMKQPTTSSVPLLLTPALIQGSFIPPQVALSSINFLYEL